MADKGTMQDHIDDLMIEVARLRARLREFETRISESKVIHAPRCGCGLTMNPSLLNVTGFNDSTQAWIIGWRCIADGHHGHAEKVAGND